MIWNPLLNFKHFNCLNMLLLLYRIRICNHTQSPGYRITGLHMYFLTPWILDLSVVANEETGRTGPRKTTEFSFAITNYVHCTVYGYVQYTRIADKRFTMGGGGMRGGGPITSVGQYSRYTVYYTVSLVLQ